MFLKSYYDKYQYSLVLLRILSKFVVNGQKLKFGCF